MPFEVARSHANIATAKRKDPQIRDLSWAKLNREPLKQYEDNWRLLSIDAAELPLMTR